MIEFRKGKIDRFPYLLDHSRIKQNARGQNAIFYNFPVQVSKKSFCNSWCFETSASNLMRQIFWQQSQTRIQSQGLIKSHKLITQIPYYTYKRKENLEWEKFANSRFIQKLSTSFWVFHGSSLNQLTFIRILHHEKEGSQNLTLWNKSNSNPFKTKPLATSTRFHRETRKQLLEQMNEQKERKWRQQKTTNMHNYGNLNLVKFLMRYYSSFF